MIIILSFPPTVAFGEVDNSVHQRLWTLNVDHLYNIPLPCSDHDATQPMPELYAQDQVDGFTGLKYPVYTVSKKKKLPRLTAQ